MNQQSEKELKENFLRNLELSQHREDHDGEKFKIQSSKLNGIYPRIPGRSTANDFNPDGIPNSSPPIKESSYCYNNDNDTPSSSSVYNDEDDTSYYTRMEEERHREEDERRREEEQEKEETEANCIALAVGYSEYLNNGGEPVSFDDEK